MAIDDDAEKTPTVDTAGLVFRLKARLGYEAYGDHAGWLNFSGAKMPLWDELPEYIRGHWVAATKAIINA